MSDLVGNPEDRFSHNEAHLFPEDLLLQEDLIQMLPMVAEANAMAETLKKAVKFEITLVSSHAQGLKSGRTEVRNHNHAGNMNHIEREPVLGF